VPSLLGWEGITTKTVTLGHMARIIGGRLIRGNQNLWLRAANFGKPKYLRSDQIYFYSKKKSWHQQLDAIRRVRPKAVVLMRSLSADLIPSSVGLITVDDTFAAFWRLALWNWNQTSPRVIGITGSAGKSTTTEMTASILKRKWSLIKTQGNLNTYSFLPSYLVRLSPGHRILLLEMGMKSLNNIARQCRVVRPEIGAVTNVGEAHVGSLGGLDRVVRAKQELINGMRSGGTLFLNADDPRSRKLSTHHFRGALRTFGIRNPADLRAHSVRYTARGMEFRVRLGSTDYAFRIPVFGVHNVYNALVAIGIARALHVPIRDIQEGLASFQPPKMRLQLVAGRGGRTLINDAWNANPTAMMEGLKVLKHVARGRPAVAVLGDMLELGNLSRWAHQQVGKFIVKTSPDWLVTVGKSAREIGTTAASMGMNPSRVRHFSTREGAARFLQQLPRNAVIYFKASRKLHFEKLVKQLRAP
jgi:UDP-N-acetylmuramoyl-tripeptide--D-alanyl-D-alanine ligase